MGKFYVVQDYSGHYPSDRMQFKSGYPGTDYLRMREQYYMQLQIVKEMLLCIMVTTCVQCIFKFFR